MNLKLTEWKLQFINHESEYYNIFYGILSISSFTNEIE